MKLVLRKDIEPLGLCGDIVDVSAGYARNYLLPHHLALEPTKANLRQIEDDKRVAAAERARRHAMMKQALDRLTGAEVTITAACTPEGHLYGSVGPREIGRALLDEGHSVQTDQIRLSHNFKEIGTYEVPVVLTEELRTTVKVWVVAEKSLEQLEGSGETDVTDDDAMDRPADDAPAGPAEE